MVILQIIPGSGGSFYCGNCLRDSKYVDALRIIGHDVIKIPMYLPLFSDKRDITDVPVFYGAVALYLKQLYPVFRKAPAWFDKILNSKPLLQLAAGFAGSTRAKGLEEMTISMLLGEEGQQKEELEKMVDWIAQTIKPDVINLSNALLLGLVKRLKEKIKVPVFCSLQDEDTWVDVMKPSSRDMVWKLMQKKAEDVDGFISVSDFYKEVMRVNLNIPSSKLYRVHIGVEPSDYEFILPKIKDRTIGFSSRECYANGLDILVDAFIELRSKAGFEDVKLVITGGSTGDDSSFKKGLSAKLVKAGLINDVDFHKDFEGEGRRAFFKKVSVISVPVRNGEAFGIYLLEAMASGIPVIQPALGAFPEIINISGGGIIYEQNTPDKLADALASVLSNPDLLNKLSVNGRKGVEQHFNISKLAMETAEIYNKIIQKKE